MKIGPRILVGLLLINLVFTSFTVSVFAQGITPSVALSTESTEPEPAPEEQILQNLPDLSASASAETNQPSPSFSDGSNNPSATIKSLSIIRNLFKRGFRANERIEVNVDNAENVTLSADVYDADGQEVEVETFTKDEGSRKVLVVKPPVHFKPGKYSVKITTSDGQVYEQDLTWGVLAINTNKSIYTPNETAKLAMAVLDERGEMVCDASLELRITHSTGSGQENEKIEELSTENGKIKVNESCSKKEVTVIPDYEAIYQVGEAGTYQMDLTAVTENGSYTITDIFEVRNSVLFDIERVTATRIFPPLPYPVDLIITANEDFEGTVTEVVPGNFAVDQSSTSQALFTTEVASQTSLETLLSSSSANLGVPYEGYNPINQEFGEQILKDPQERNLYARFNLAGHDGVDFDLPWGTPVLASDDGTVSLAGQGAYGLTVVIDHDWGRSYYGHLSSLKVNVEDRVERGFVIGFSGSTGLSTGPHLHFGMKPNKADMENGYYGKIDPLPFLGIASYQDNTLKILSWKISVKKGEKINLGYFYKAPNISPQFYKLGPLRFTTNLGVKVFEEARQWQIAVDADGSGTNTVSPSTGTTSAQDQTYTFTFTAGETMDSGEIKITAPSGWNAPQGSSGTAGYTTVTGNGNATVATVFNAFDSATGWSEVGGTDACQTGPTTDTTNKQEGSASITCDDSTSGANGPDNGDGIRYNFTSQDWSSYTQFAFWMRSQDGDSASAFTYYINDGTDCTTSPIITLSSSALTANQWAYEKITLSGTRTAVANFCVLAATSSSLDNNQIWVDEGLLGPGTPSFSGQSVSFRVLDAANGETFSIVYGDGGGTSGVDNPATPDIYTFTTQSRPIVTGTLANLTAGSPTIELCDGGCGPTNAQLMRHGKWLDAGTENAFTF